MGLLDRIVDKQKARVIRDTLTVDHAEAALLSALDHADENDNQLVQLVVDHCRGNVRPLAEGFNDFLLAYAFGEEKHGMQAVGDGEDDVRFLMRLRIHHRLTAQAVNTKKWSRKHARMTVKLEITDERIIESAKKIKNDKGMQGPPLEDAGSWWQWIADNWITILSSLLPLLLLFL